MRKSFSTLVIPLLIWSSSREMRQNGPVGDITPLARLAASMSAGSWAKLTTNGPTQAMIYPGKGQGILPYTTKLVWDSNHHVGYLFGGEHVGPGPCSSGKNFDMTECADVSSRFIKYDEATNSWVDQIDSVTGKPHSGISGSPGAHGNGELAIDP